MLQKSRLFSRLKTFVIGQNLNQLRQKHLRDVCALQRLARSSIYRGRFKSLQLSSLLRILSRDSKLF